MHLANMITLTRIVLSPLFVALFLAEDRYFRLAALAVVVLCELTDLLDGYVARKYDQVSDIGKLLDPMADSVFRFSVFLSFYATGYADLWMILVFFYRDSLVAWIRVVAATQNCVVGARISGKVKAWAQGCASIPIIVLVNLEYWTDVPHLHVVCRALMSMAAAVTLYSAFDYFLGNLPLLRAAARAKPKP